MTRSFKTIFSVLAGTFACALGAFALGTSAPYAEEQDPAEVWTVSPQVTQWVSGKFVPSVNVIDMTPASGEITLVGIVNAQKTSLGSITVTSGAGAETVVTLDDLTVAPSTSDDSERFPYYIVDGNDGSISAAINTLPVGEYNLHVVIDDSIDTYTSFNILKQNSWVRTPSIAAWSYGGFVAEQNIIIAEPAELPVIGYTEPTEDSAASPIRDRVHFSVIDADGNVAYGTYTDAEGESRTIELNDIDVVLGSDDAYKNYYRVVNEYVEALNSLDAGKYTLRAWVNADDEYGYLDYEGDIPFRVFQGYNSWVETPSIIRWEYGSFDRDINLISAKVKYTTEFSGRDEFITFTVTDAEGESIDDLGGFHIMPSGMVGETQEAAFKKLDAGEYNLTVEVMGSNNYYPIDPVTIKFDVLKATNAWVDYPAVEPWKVDDFLASRNTPVATALHGQAVIIITDAETGEDVYYNSAEGINRLNEMRPDSYLMTATVAGNDNYTDLNQSVLFRVFTADEIVEGGGMPWWGVLLIVVGSLGIVAGVLAILHVKGVLSMFTSKMIASIRAKADIDATISAVRAGKITAYAQHTMLMIEAEERQKAALQSGESSAADAIPAPSKEDKKAAKEAAALDRKADELDAKAKKLKAKSGKDAEKRAEELEAQAEVVRDIADSRKQKAAADAPKADEAKDADGMIIDEQATIPPPEDGDDTDKE